MTTHAEMEKNMSDLFYTKWHMEMDIFYKVKPIMIMEGNILDQFQYPTDQSVVDISRYLKIFLKDKGYETVVFFDDIGGFYHPDSDTEGLERFRRLSGCQSPLRNNRIQVPFSGRDETAPLLVQNLLSQNDSPSAVVMNFASRYITSPESLSKEEVNSFTNLLVAGTRAAEVQLEDTGVFAKNLLFFIVNKTNDIPAWFYLNNPNVKILYLSTPSKEERSKLIKGERFRTFFNRKIFEDEIKNYLLTDDEKALLSPEEASARQEKLDRELEKIQDKFVGMTEGFTFLELNDLRKLCKNELCHIATMSEVVDLYRYGIRENPWTRHDLQEALRTAEDRFIKRVKGQNQAITKTMDVVKRAATGMSGLQHSSHTKPKGILFFAGPTGTGKTETAKTLAEILFGDESRCIRFDMSEFSQPQSDQKLLGAPPGYVGYEAGGQLTNAVRENPFSILLFDEIEKAHGSIFDKFLQILEDGRMTDGQGKTVYFSESIIIFTSNLGI
jgi:ATP-dependent Lon protease